MKNKKIKNLSDKSLSVTKTLEKINYFSDLITRTTIWVEKTKTYDIINASDYNLCILNLETCFNELVIIKKLLNLLDDNNETKNKKKTCNEIISKLQKVNDDLSLIFKTFGTNNISDILTVCFGNKFLKDICDEITDKDKLNLIMNYTHPISYKVINWKNEPKTKTNKDKIIKNKILEDFIICEMSENIDCYDLCRTSTNFYTKVYGIKIIFQNKEKKSSIIINAIIDDLIVNCINNDFITKKKELCLSNKPNEKDFKIKSFNNFISHLTIKEWLIYNNNELYNRYIGYVNQAYLIKQKTISQVVKEFINAELFAQRKTLIILLIQSGNSEFEYLAYLLYDLLSNENNSNIDTLEQTMLFDSLPWEIKTAFRNAMKNTIKYTKNLSSFDNSKIPIEQQICLLKAPQAVKEKAMIKLKEVKAKSEDSGSKARQYLDGLLKIPFGIFKKEKVLEIADENSKSILLINAKLKELNIDIPWQIKKKYTNIEIRNIIIKIDNELLKIIKNKNIDSLKHDYCLGKKYDLITNVCYINSIIKQKKIKHKKLCHSGKKNSYMREHINLFIEKYKNNDELIRMLKTNKNKDNIINNKFFIEKINKIKNQKKTISNSIIDINKTLDSSIHGHKDAKRQLERIIGQWITGKQTGYCFGFEGPPGVGKTSLAKKGLAYCLKDDNGDSRPFSFIALGGSSNGSTLAGHNYTYVGSTWGRIVDILMEKKCMNPIIFIDELDKVSRTEHGKEIIGILTHLVDPTQNMAFQDKYFNGVDIDMSKVLFIFSYNDVSKIDKILLDRIHRIKFNYLTLTDKIEITKLYLLPEIYENMGVENIIEFSDEIITFIIENYTNEAGVRKLKELIFEVISEINLSILKETNEYTIPIKLSIKDVETIYLKNRIKINRVKIHTTSKIGVISGLWANSLGLGGVIPIQAFHYPCNNFLELKLTGMQGDVMKESMNVAKTLAWNLTKYKQKEKFLNKHNKEKGLHIHCPEGAVPKDGPSAGTAITIAIYSLLNSKKIKNNIAITGEINLQGMVTEIGGLELKILGGIRAGVTEFIFPKSNIKDYNKFLEKYTTIDVSNITFYPVSTIEEVLKLVFE